MPRVLPYQRRQYDRHPDYDEEQDDHHYQLAQDEDSSEGKLLLSTPLAWLKPWMV